MSEMSEIPEMPAPLPACKAIPLATPLPAILLAAGMSRRMGQCKLLLPFRGQPLLLHALHNALASGVLDPLVVVLGPHTPPEVSDIVTAFAHTAPGARVVLSTAPDAALGQAESLKAGLAKVLELSPDAPGVAVLLADQALIPPTLLLALHAEFCTAQAAGAPACVAPVFAGQRGNPVFLPCGLFAQIAQLSGDEGARSLLAHWPLHLVSSSDDGCLRDVDTPDQYKSLLSSSTRQSHV